MSKNHALGDRLSFIGLDDRARRALRSLSGFVARELPNTLDRFYSKVRATPEIRRFFSDDRHIEGAKSAQEGTGSARPGPNLRAAASRR